MEGQHFKAFSNAIRFHGVVPASNSPTPVRRFTTRRNTRGCRHGVAICGNLRLFHLMTFKYGLVAMDPSPPFTPHISIPPRNLFFCDKSAGYSNEVRRYLETIALLWLKGESPELYMRKSRTLILVSNLYLSFKPSWKES